MFSQASVANTFFLLPSWWKKHSLLIGTFRIWRLRHKLRLDKRGTTRRNERHLSEHFFLAMSVTVGTSHLSSEVLFRNYNVKRTTSKASIVFAHEPKKTKIRLSQLYAFKQSHTKRYILGVPLPKRYKNLHWFQDKNTTQYILLLYFWFPNTIAKKTFLNLNFNFTIKLPRICR